MEVRSIDEDALALRTLAERLLAGILALDPNDAHPDLVVGGIPENLTVDVPLPEGFSVLGSLTMRYEERDREKTEVVLDAGARPPEEALERVREAVLGAGEGWQELDLSKGLREGFLPGPPTERALFCQSERGPALEATAGRLPDGTADARVVLTVDGRNSPCSLSAHEPGDWRSEAPGLSPPAGARDTGLGMGYRAGPDDFQASTSLRTDLGPSELEAHYAEQFEREGWERSDVASGAGREHAWSGWTRHDAEGRPWAAAFSATRAPGSARLCFLHVLGCATFGE